MKLQEFNKKKEGNDNKDWVVIYESAGKKVGEKIIIAPCREEAYRYVTEYLGRPLKIKESPYNPKDVVKIDIPLLIRLLEYAREDAKTDMDLHDLAEKLIQFSSEPEKVLCMKDYDHLVPDTGKEFQPEKPEPESSDTMSQPKESRETIKEFFDPWKDKNVYTVLSQQSKKVYTISMISQDRNGNMKILVNYGDLISIREWMLASDDYGEYDWAESVAGDNDVSVDMVKAAVVAAEYAQGEVKPLWKGYIVRKIKKAGTPIKKKNASK